MYEATKKKMLTEINVVASDNETFEKYGDEIDFTIEVEWDESTINWESGFVDGSDGAIGKLEEFVGAKIKEAYLNGKLMLLTDDLKKFAVKKLKQGWFKATNLLDGYSGKILDMYEINE